MRGRFNFISILDLMSTSEVSVKEERGFFLCILNPLGIDHFDILFIFFFFFFYSYFFPVYFIFIKKEVSDLRPLEGFYEVGGG